MCAQWIAYPGEFEHYHHSRISMLRRERSAPYPTFYKMDGWYTNICFSRDFCLDKPETAVVACEGEGYILLDGQRYPAPNPALNLPAGSHRLEIRVGCLNAPPALWLEGPSLASDGAWTADCGLAQTVPAAVLPLRDPASPPSAWRLPTVRWDIASQRSLPQGLMVDLGREGMGMLAFTPLADGKITLYYGESEAEALAMDEAEVYETAACRAGEAVVMPVARAMRYCLLSGIAIRDPYFLYEVLPHERPGRFACSSDRINAIYDVAYHTMELCTREFFLDGIKRDRWLWAGDALQSVMINHYTFFDRDVARRTLRALRGKDPFEKHINTILDYTFYWYMAIWDDYLYTGDDSFIREMYPKMVTALDFCLGRRNGDGFMEGQPGDWVFVDWADHLPVDGELCVEQMLLARALFIQAQAAHMVGDAREEEYALLASQTQRRVLEVFWDEKEGVLRHYRKDGAVQPLVTRYPTLFALQFDLLPRPAALDTARRVLLSDTVQKITTPYMHFYELDALGRLGLVEDVVQEMDSYWGGMLDEGATSFWETFDPGEDDHYAMYGRPFGRSLCHCWGAGPLYLAGRYLLGVHPTEPGYARYEVEPCLGGLEWIEGDVPTPQGKISVRMDGEAVTVTGCGGEGRLILSGQPCPKGAQPLEDGRWSLPIRPYETVTLKR